MTGKGIYLLITLLVLVSCGEETSLQNPVKKAEPTYYILCDFSASQGHQSLQTIMQNADTLFRRACRQRARTIYLDISAAAYEKPFFDYSIAHNSIITGTARRKQEQEMAAQADTLHQRMIRICKRPSSNNTCIIRTIEKVASCLPRDIGPDRKDQPIKLVILSDLLEDCQNGVRRINIDHADFAAAFQTLSRMPAPTSTFSTYSNMEVTLVASSERIIKQDSLNTFWKEVFKKFKYELVDDISVSLPGWAQRK